MAFTFLIVDDSTTMRRIIKKVLDLTKLKVKQVLEASNGADGLTTMRASEIDLVFVDLHMPVMTGMEMIVAMGADPLLRGIPVIVISSEGNQAVIDSLAEKGVREIISKPFEPALLRKVIESTLQTNH